MHGIRIIIFIKICLPYSHVRLAVVLSSPCLLHPGNESVRFYENKIVLSQACVSPCVNVFLLKYIQLRGQGFLKPHLFNIKDNPSSSEIIVTYPFKSFCTSGLEGTTMKGEMALIAVSKTLSFA